MPGRDILDEYRRLGIAPISGGDGTDDDRSDSDASDDNGTDDEPIDGLGDKGKEAIRRERDARKAVEARNAETEKELAALRKREAERDAEKRKADEEAAAKRGEFEALAQTREAERDAATTEATSLKAENDRLRAAIANVLTDEWKALPAEVRDAYLGADDDPLGKLAFLPKGKALAAKLSGADAQRGNGQNPPASGGARPTLEQTKEEMRRHMGLRPVPGRSG